MRAFRSFIFLLLVLAVFAGGGYVVANAEDFATDPDSEKKAEMISGDPRWSEDGGGEITASATCAAAMAVIESGSGRVLFESRAYDKRPMASTTKILTAITVLENVKDISVTVKVPKGGAGIEGSSIYLEEGEEITIENLLYGLMLQSGNDCAASLAIITAGSLPAFADKMNETARKAGAEHSNFVTPHGLHDDNHYTTAMDLAKISAYAMKNDNFRTVVGTKQRKMPWAGRKYPRVVTNKNKILNTLDGGNGIKTGFTKKAGRCLVASAKRGNMEVISVVLNCGPMFEECRSLIDRAFATYKMQEILPPHRTAGEVAVTGSKRQSIRVGTLEARYYPMKDSERDCVTIAAEIGGPVKAPVSAGQDAGKLKVYFKNQLLFTEKIYTMEEAQSLTVKDRLKEIVDNWFR